MTLYTVREEGRLTARTVRATSPGHAVQLYCATWGGWGYIEPLGPSSWRVLWHWQRAVRAYQVIAS